MTYEPVACPHPTCSAHGMCNSDTGKCFCHSGYGGADCATKQCAGNCHGRGTCSEGTCVCTAPYAGKGCLDEITVHDVNPKGFLTSQTTQLTVVVDYMPRPTEPGVLLCAFVDGQAQGSLNGAVGSNVCACCVLAKYACFLFASVVVCTHSA